MILMTAVWQATAMPEWTTQVSADDTDDRCQASNSDARVDDGGVVDDSDVWKARAMPEQPTFVSVNDTDDRCLTGNCDARVDDAGVSR